MNLLKKSSNLLEQAISLKILQIQYAISNPNNDSVVSRHLSKREVELGNLSEFTKNVGIGFKDMANSGLYDDPEESEVTESDEYPMPPDYDPDKEDEEEDTES